MSPYDGARARALRLQARLSVEDLAAAAGVSPNTVRSAESGTHQPRPRVAQAIARALGVPPRKLIPSRTGLTLRDVRCRLGLTQAEMAARIGVVRQMVSQVERGVTGVRSPLDWAAAYRLTLAQWTRAHQASRDLVRQKVAAQARRRRRKRSRGDST
ncbi:helix-turn-helix transcriptional regulator [Streptomyces sp. NPDC051041]|uniref:helix-turn-helix transcriptional regulator n=1 Tax=Streptomyces sp. NPDC051041 TaxID=3365640 RepID=UPI00379A4CD2